MAKNQEQKDKQEWLVALGEYIRKVRLKKGVTGAELARRLFMDKPNVTRLEKGRVNPSVYLIKQICDACEISIAEFWKGFKL